MKRSPLKRRTPLRRSPRPSARATDLKLVKQLCRRLVVELRDGNACQRCPNTHAGGMQIHWAHVKNRNAKSILCAPWNSLALCAGCHFWFDGNKGNTLHPGAGILWWRERFPERAAQLDAWERGSRPRVNLELDRLYLEQEIARLGG